MFIPIIAIIVSIIGGFIFWGEPDYDHTFSLMWLMLGGTMVLGWIVILGSSYYATKADLTVIDQKIELKEAINKEKIDSVLPILEKYPQLEKEIVGGINPNAFAVLGDIYPDLKSNESYKQEADLVLGNIKEIEDLKVKKIDSQKSIYFSSTQLFLLN